jgi:ribosome biogenesis GTPase
MLTGVVIKSYSGFHYVRVDNRLWECSLRGRFRLTKQSILVGDQVQINVLDEEKGKGVVDSILPRRTQMDRPAVANVDQVVIIAAIKDPDLSRELLDRMLIIIEALQLTPVICFNKVDLLSDAEEINKLTEIYGPHYRVLVTSSKTLQGVEQLREELKGRISVFAGPSGAGKSSLLNDVQPGLSLKTGEVSAKIGRGKHTTRHVELLDLDFGGMVADSPGFSALFLPDIKKEELADCFPEFREYEGTCKFKGCLHYAEPNCAVKLAVAAGKIYPCRYEHYLHFLHEVAGSEKKY